MTDTDQKMPEFLKREFSDAEWRDYFPAHHELRRNGEDGRPVDGFTLEVEYREVLKSLAKSCQIQPEDSPALQRLKYRAVARITAEIISRNFPGPYDPNSIGNVADTYLNRCASLLRSISIGLLDQGVARIEDSLVNAMKIIIPLQDKESDGDFQFIQDAFECLENAPGLTIEGYNLGKGKEKQIGFRG